MTCKCTFKTSDRVYLFIYFLKGDCNYLPNKECQAPFIPKISTRNMINH